MFHTFLLVSQLLIPTNSYNLVIDTQAKGINTYLRNFRREYEEELENLEIRTIIKKRCLGTVEFKEITVSDVSVRTTTSLVVDTDYYLKIEHLHARLHGLYKHNVLFIQNTGDFEVNIQDLNATLGPLVPINIGGIPYLNQEITCSISHTEGKISVQGGILRWIAKRRLSDTMKDDLERIFCDSLVGILDGKIRKSLADLNLLLPVNEGITVSYLLADQPLLLPYGAIRTYHLGVTSSHHSGAKYSPTKIESNHDVIYHIHDALLSEVVQSVCMQGYMDGNFTYDDKHVNIVCQKASISVKNMEITNTASVLLALVLKFQGEEEMMVSKRYTMTVLHSNRLTLLFRLKSEVVDSNDLSVRYSDQIFSMLSEVMRSHVSLPLPVPAGAQTDGSMIKLQPDRVIFATDFVFRGK